MTAIYSKNKGRDSCLEIPEFKKGMLPSTISCKARESFKLIRKHSNPNSSKAQAEALFIQSLIKAQELTQAQGLSQELTPPRQAKAQARSTPALCAWYFLPSGSFWRTYGPNPSYNRELCPNTFAVTVLQQAITAPTCRWSALPAKAPFLMYCIVPYYKNVGSIFKIMSHAS